MIFIKTAGEIEVMREGGKRLNRVMSELAAIVRPGVKTGEIDRLAEKLFKEVGGKASFKNYRGFPASVCVSVNDEVVHGIPGKRRLNEGDIVGLDVGLFYRGLHTDMARTFPVGSITKEASRLIQETEACFWSGVKQIRQGSRIGDISAAIEAHAHKCGYGVVRELTGHGVGRELHEDPDVPNFTSRTRGQRIANGMALAVEPMINMGTYDVKWLDDGWTVVTADGSVSAHYENTVVLWEDELLVLTAGEQA